jgi:hypothetical protein
MKKRTNNPATNPKVRIGLNTNNQGHAICPVSFNPRSKLWQATTGVTKGFLRKLFFHGLKAVESTKGHQVLIERWGQESEP